MSGDGRAGTIQFEVLQNIFAVHLDWHLTTQTSTNRYTDTYIQNPDGQIRLALSYCQLLRCYRFEWLTLKI